MWSDWLVVCNCGFSLSALWCPLSVPTFFLGFLLPWMWGFSSWLLQQSTATARYFGRGVAPLSCHACVPSRLSQPPPLTVWIIINCGKFWKRWEYQTTWPASWETYNAGQEAPVRTGRGTTDWLQIGKGVCQGWEMLGWKKHKLESRLLGEISIISVMQMISPLWQKVKKN